MLFLHSKTLYYEHYFTLDHILSTFIPYLLLIYFLIKLLEVKKNLKTIQSIAPITNNVTEINKKIIEKSKLNP